MIEADLPQVVGLERRIFPDPWPLSAFAELLADNEWYSFVAGLKEVVTGYACFLVVAGECHLANIAVDPAFRRKSVAKHLLDRIFDVASENRCVAMLLEVRVSNKDAIAFYERFGFEELYRRIRYYRNPVENALVMIKDLGAGTEDE